MKWLACLSAIILVVLGAAYQESLPQLLQQHLKTLREAQSLTATINVTPIGEAATEYRLSYSKPNLLKVTSPDGFTVIDGKTIYTYNAKDKSYTEVPATDEAINAALRKELWAWSAFFAKKDEQFAKAGRAGAARNMKGVAVTEVSVTPTETGFGQATLYIDPKLGFARGFNLKTTEKEYLAVATEVKISTDPLPAGDFAFTAPAGSKKVDPAAAPAATYEQVQAIMNRSCMPCHNVQNNKGGLTLTTYEGIRAAVVPGSPATSELTRSLRASGARRMPKNAAPLPEATIKVVEQWVADGAKQ